jgi:DNA polymerase-1
MRHIIYAQRPTYETAILIKEAALQPSEIKKFYVDPLEKSDYPSEKVVVFTLDYNSANKAPVGHCKQYLAQLLPALKKLQTKFIYCADSNYFKALTKNTKADVQLGYILPCAIEGYTDMKVILGINYQALTYNPNQTEKLDLSISTLCTYLKGTYEVLGADILKWASYPVTESEVDKAFAEIMKWPEVFADIEAFSLHPFKAGIGTIGFSPDETGGIGFRCDMIQQEGENVRIFNTMFRHKLRKFFEAYEGKVTWHHAGYDVKVLIYNLYMADPLDNAGLLQGLEVMTKNIDDTKLIAYLALNSTAGNELGLKSLAHSFAGNWAKSDITNIMAIPLMELLQYNVIDCMSTAWVKKKYYPQMVADGQLKIYKEQFLPSQKCILQIELTGMPLIPDKVQEARVKLQTGLDAAIQLMRGTRFVRETEKIIQRNAMDAANAKLKTKQHPLEHFSHLQFNPGSNQQVAILLYDVMGLPVIERTKTKQPSSASDTIDKLIFHAKTLEAKAVMQALIDYNKVSKILSSFIPAFEAAFDKGNGRAYLHGSYNLGGTLSGRLSSSDPNMQNMPSGSTFGKLIKYCFSAPDGWVFAGADFASLEDRINALLTQDPNKIKVYTDGYDGHCLRAHAYFGDQMPDVVDTIESINSIDTLYPLLRQDSKAPTFALTYLGTWMTLVKNCGFSREEAQRIEANFHALYKVSGEWVADKIKKATEVGYGTGAFGLRIRTPLLKRSILGSSRTLREAEAEGRSLGNAVSGQSYGLLTNRAVNAFMQKIWVSPFRNDILPVALIHDAIYLLIRANPAAIKFANDHLIEEMAWKGLPEIADPRVPLPANLDLFYPNWATPITLENNISESEIRNAVSDELLFRRKIKWVEQRKFTCTDPGVDTTKWKPKDWVKHIDATGSWTGA